MSEPFATNDAEVRFERFLGNLLRTGVLLADLCIGKPRDESPLPVMPVARIPLHAFRRPAMEAAVAWYRLLDRMGA